MRCILARKCESATKRGKKRGDGENGFCGDSLADKSACHIFHAQLVSGIVELSEHWRLQKAIRLDRDDPLYRARRVNFILQRITNFHCRNFASLPFLGQVRILSAPSGPRCLCIHLNNINRHGLVALFPFQKKNTPSN